MRTGSRVTAAWLALAVGVPLALAGCGDDGGERPTFVGATATPGASPTVAAAPLRLTVTPAANARNLPVSTEVGTAVSGGTVTAVTLTDDKGATVAGAMRDDGSSWVPGKALAFGRTYTARVTATDAGGRAETRTTTFSTMKSRPGRKIGTGLYLFDGKTYGVAMPVVVEFVPGIARKDRAGVQRRLFVSSVPPQPGTWHWVANGTQAYYRPPAFWQPGTKITVRMGLDGHPVGKGRYGNVDRRASVTIGRKLVLDVDNKTKQMRVLQGDRLVKRLPVSLGKKSTPSSSGTMVIMDKQESTVFDTFAELGPREGYRTTIAYAQRLTWGGEFIHAAPWSVGAQGRRNVSHGCVNISSPNATWLFGLTMVGDPVTVRGTERKLVAGNGWTAWNHTWADFIAGSALPVPPELAAATGATDR
ncbi:MAG TPA: Ig-like domain-containing protein [Pilimelia sp.]|nr:Ig-like domain-containing protein [Pilimelia sp.]